MSEYSVTAEGLVHIYAAAEHGHRSASFAGRPEISYSGNTALVAAKRLVRAVEGLDESTLRGVGQSENGCLAALTVRPTDWGSECPECGGTGRYVGLAVIEECEACGGSGIALSF